MFAGGWGVEGQTGVGLGVCWNGAYCSYYGYDDGYCDDYGFDVGDSIDWVSLCLSIVCRAGYYLSVGRFVCLEMGIG